MRRNKWWNQNKGKSESQWITVGGKHVKVHWDRKSKKSLPCISSPQLLIASLCWDLIYYYWTISYYVVRVNHRTHSLYLEHGRPEEHSCPCSWAPGVSGQAWWRQAYHTWAVASSAQSECLVGRSLADRWTAGILWKEKKQDVQGVGRQWLGREYGRQKINFKYLLDKPICDLQNFVGSEEDSTISRLSHIAFTDFFAIKRWKTTEFVWTEQEKRTTITLSIGL